MTIRHGQEAKLRRRRRPETRRRRKRAASNCQDRRDQAGQPIGGSEAFAAAGGRSAESGLRGPASKWAFNEARPSKLKLGRIGNGPKSVASPSSIPGRGLGRRSEPVAKAKWDINEGE